MNRDAPTGADRVAVVTGAGRGLGLETCRQLAARGCRVVLTARDAGRGSRAAHDLADAGPEVATAVLDVADPDSIAAFAGWLEREIGRLDVLVNNAGVPPDGGGLSVFDVPLETMQRAMATHVYGPLLLTRSVLPLMEAGGYGRIVNVSSTLGQLQSMGPRWPAYRISKAALNALTAATAAELEARGSGNILVNSVCPGWTRTDLGGPKAPRSVQEGADTIVWLATLPDDGPSGGFFQDRRKIDW
ncbi:MAG TPA: SDR family NAD(P)-dependent oxidoreductase [Gammaproteobacteria bacterium]|nr:SDR family NAD(P)-dependent oxidoreductase [Gammaproteobacteria bacterium]